MRRGSVIKLIRKPNITNPSTISGTKKIDRFSHNSRRTDQCIVRVLDSAAPFISPLLHKEGSFRATTVRFLRAAGRRPLPDNRVEAMLGNYHLVMRYAFANGHAIEPEKHRSNEQ